MARARAFMRPAKEVVVIAPETRRTRRAQIPPLLILGPLLFLNAHDPITIGIGIITAVGVVLALLPNPFNIGRSGQILLGTATVMAAWFSTPLLDFGGPRPIEMLSTFWLSTALVLLTTIGIRLALARPLGGTRASAALGVMTLVACGGAKSGISYPILCGLWLLTQWWSMSRIDPDRVGPLKSSRRGRIATVFALALIAIVAWGTATALPIAHRWAMQRMGFSGESTQTGFSTMLRLGDLNGMLESQTPVLRITGPAPSHLRGVVYARYRLGRWFGGKWPRAIPKALPEMDEKGPISADEWTEIRPAKRVRRYFLPMDAREIRASIPGVRLHEMGIVLTPPGEDAGIVQFVKGPRNQAPVASPNSAPGAWDLEVPEELSKRLGEIADLWLPATLSPRARMEALRQRFQTDFTYSLHAKFLGGVDPVIDFLDRVRMGHCEYFAAASALLARSSGIPARVVGGWLVTEFNPIAGHHIVRESNAHAWVEVWLDGAWETFDATPSSGLAEHMNAETPTLGALWDVVTDWFSRALEALSLWSPTEWLFYVALPTALWVAFRLRRKEEDEEEGSIAQGSYTPPLDALNDLEAGLRTAFNLSRPEGETLRRFATRCDDSAPAAATAIRHYAAWRYGTEGSAQDASRQLTEAMATLTPDAA